MKEQLNWLEEKERKKGTFICFFSSLKQDIEIDRKIKWPLGLLISDIEFVILNFLFTFFSVSLGEKKKNGGHKFYARHKIS